MKHFKKYWIKPLWAVNMLWSITPSKLSKIGHHLLFDLLEVFQISRLNFFLIVLAEPFRLCLIARPFHLARSKTLFCNFIREQSDAGVFSSKRNFSSAFYWVGYPEREAEQAERP
jgi:hypothetical protein